MAESSMGTRWLLTYSGVAIWLLAFTFVLRFGREAPRSYTGYSVDTERISTGGR